MNGKTIPIILGVIGLLATIFGGIMASVNGRVSDNDERIRNIEVFLPRMDERMKAVQTQQNEQTKIMQDIAKAVRE